MATDRIFLVCDECKEYIYLYNWSPGGGVYFDKNNIEGINDFLYEHELCVTTAMETLDKVGITFGNESAVWKTGYTEYKVIEKTGTDHDHDYYHDDCSLCKLEKERNG